MLLEWLTIDSLILFCIGMVAAIIGVMFGAAGLVLLPAMLISGIPIHSSVAVNKFATGLSSFTTVLVLTFNKRIRLKKMLPLMLVACFGGISGAYLATRLTEKTMNIVACIVLVVMFFLVIKANKTGLVSKEDKPEQKDRKKYNLAPYFIGLYDGGIGPGSGLLYITYFLKKQYSYVKAAEMTRFMMFSSCMSAFLFYFFYGIVDWGVAIFITLGSIAGSHIGLKIIPYIKARWVQVIFPIIFILLIGQVLSDLLF